MKSLEEILTAISKTFIPVLDASIPLHKYVPIDLSIYNEDLNSIDITNPTTCQEHIDGIIKPKEASVAYGGYLEKRGIYAANSNFSETERNIHIGVDFWAKAGTKVLAPIHGVVHSFKNNMTKGDYGPTIILKHEVSGVSFYTLYGHLSLASLTTLYIGKELKQGDMLGTLGETAINVNYAPHLHFQIIKDIAGYKGDYPGVCSKKDIEFYTYNCPDPSLLLKL